MKQNNISNNNIRVEESLENFDKAAAVFSSKLSRQILLPADTILNLRRKYAYNMFDTSSSSSTIIKSDCNANRPKKDISLDKIFTFLEYRQDRVLENYGEYLSANEEYTNLSSKTPEELLSELSFLPKKQLRKAKVVSSEALFQTSNRLS
ncbi:unnamed protein product [Rotaria magnacalcarata]|uniref:Uncharacterized protein n=1 Tax=Rotaria magnacalcarata TaxID=392030 RepID=A0A818XY40_9BILA|nr:unnamed protein product [Rotaria magnacalcarata]